MNSAATTLAPEPAPTLAELLALMIRTSAEIAETRKLTRQAMAGRDDVNALILSEARLGVTGGLIDELLDAVTVAGMSPGPASGPVAVPGPARVPPQRTPPRNPLLAVVRT